MCVVVFADLEMRVAAENALDVVVAVGLDSRVDVVSSVLRRVVDVDIWKEGGKWIMQVYMQVKCQWKVLGCRLF